MIVPRVKNTASLLFVTVLVACSQTGQDSGNSDAATATSGASGGVAGSTFVEAQTSGSQSSGDDTSTGEASDTSDSGTPPLDPNDPGDIAGDRFVAKSGEDVGDCIAAPCLTLAFAGAQMQPGEVLVVGDGSYDEPIANDTFALGADGAHTIVRAENSGAVTVTGRFGLYADQDFYLTFAGLRFESAMGKGISGGNVSFFRCAFVGGPCGGNSVNTGVGTNDFSPGAWNVLFQDCLFYGQGGRYGLLVYRAVDVTMRRIVVRKDGGWAVPGQPAECVEISPPEAGMALYEATNALCEQCIVFDSIKASIDSAEGLGGLAINANAPVLSDNDLVVDSFVVNTAYSGITFEGNAVVNNAEIRDSYSLGNRLNGVTVAIAGSMILQRVGVMDNGSDGIANYSANGPNPATVVLQDSLIAGNTGEQLRNLMGATDGSGPNTPDLSQFDNTWIRREMCELAQPRPDYDLPNEFCESGLSFTDYILSYVP